jgi:hypothetical protein
VVYCRADSARLCLPCDRHVHGANTVSTRHARAPLCARCRAAATTAVASPRGGGGGFVCADCYCLEKEDEEKGEEHRDPRPLHHDHDAVEEYAGCPSIAELAAILGVAGYDEKAAAAGGDVGWWSTWEEPQVVCLEDVVVPTTSCHGLHPLLAPPSPKVRCCFGCCPATRAIVK